MMNDSSLSRVHADLPLADAATRQLAADLQYYLSLQPRQLPSRYLYDALGSALFDAICQLPWYRITRAEHALLAAHGVDIFAAVGHLSSIVELGGGNGEKLLTLLGARDGGQSRSEAARTVEQTTRPEGPGRPEGPHYGISVHLVDVSPSALALSRRALDAVDDVRVVAHQASYENGLLRVASERPPNDGRRLLLFLGSNIGNFDPPAAAAFLTEVRASLRAGDAFLLGADLVKPERDLLLAYDDPLGVTAAFNRNLLVRINRDLAADFDVAAFAHRAVWNAEASRVEMHLVSAFPQKVTIPGVLEIDLEAGETIWTESSYKYSPAGVVEMIARAGFRSVRQWIEPDAAFALTLAEAV